MVKKVLLLYQVYVQYIILEMITFQLMEGNGNYYNQICYQTCPIRNYNFIKLYSFGQKQL
jgi:hypothetical protein